MTLRPRLIPQLLVKDGALVKGTGFANHRYLGDPLNAIRIFNEKEVDELILTDIGATQQGSGPDLSLIEDVVGECFMPLTYGGGIRRPQDAANVLALGVEKVSVQTACLESMEVVKEIAANFGSQSIVASFDAVPDGTGAYRVFSYLTHTPTPAYLEEALLEAQDSGAGEILVTSVSREGTLRGLDLALIEGVSPIARGPLVAAGGLNSVSDFHAGVRAGATAVACGAFVLFRGRHQALLISYPERSDLDHEPWQGE